MRHISNLFFSVYLLAFLPSFVFFFGDHLVCLVFNSSSEAPTHRDTSTSDEVNVTVKVRRICSVLFWDTNR